jgi:hypothetical protein
MRKLRFLALAVLIFSIPECAHAATATMCESKVDSSNVEGYTSDAFTPAAGDLLVLFTHGITTIVTPAITDSQSLGWTQSTNGIFQRSGLGTSGTIWISNSFAAASSMTVTATYTGDATTGNTMFVFCVAGMSRDGNSGAEKQSAEQNNQLAASTPAPAFGASALTGNVTLGAVFSAATPPAVTEPTGWTECATNCDIGHTLPNAGGEAVYRDSGFTGTTITWASTSSAAYCDAIIELDTTAAAACTAGLNLPLLGVGGCP